ncbi:endophilin-B1-like isoform X1 [Petromyzon marinus]|uniref:endophilin-B1-like isoform X1 n=1 Tax=Petromyzon marinus TaxID=7757 RepID=UPI003F6F31AC
MVVGPQRERTQLETKRSALSLALRRRGGATAHDAARAEQHETLAREEFGRQSRAFRRLLEGLDDAHAGQLQGLCDFVEAQAALFAVGHRYLAGLQRQLHSLEGSYVTASFQMSGQSPEATEDDAGGLPARPGAVARSGGDQ